MEPLLTKLSQARDLKARIAQLEREIQTERLRALATLPAEYGFTSATSFLEAVKKAAGLSRAERHRKRRTNLSAVRRKQLIADLRGGMTYPQAVKEYGVSPGTVYNVKKAAGLV